MSDLDDFDAELCHWYSFKASFCRVVSDALLPTRMKIRVGIEIIDEEELEYALTRINHWVEHFLSRVIAVGCQDTNAFEMLLDEDGHPRLDNPIMVTPQPPTDAHLMVLFQAKIEALAEGAFLISSVDGESNNASGLTVTYLGDTQSALPEMSDWLAGPSWFTTPWWNRCDVSMIDIVAGEEADLSIRPAWASNFDFLKETEVVPAQIIIGDFEPKLVKDDDKDK